MMDEDVEVSQHELRQQRSVIDWLAAEREAL